MHCHVSSKHRKWSMTFKVSLLSSLHSCNCDLVLQYYWILAKIGRLQRIGYVTTYSAPMLLKPTLEYAASAWDCQFVKFSIKLEKVQRAVAHFIFNDYGGYSIVTGILNSKKYMYMQLLLETREKAARLKNLYKICKG